MKPPIIITTSGDAAAVVIKTVWHCTRQGHPGMLVYSPLIALEKLAEGFDVELGHVIRVPRGGGHGMRQTRQ